MASPSGSVFLLSTWTIKHVFFTLCRVLRLAESLRFCLPWLVTISRVFSCFPFSSEISPLRAGVQAVLREHEALTLRFPTVPQPPTWSKANTHHFLSPLVLLFISYLVMNYHFKVYSAATSGLYTISWSVDWNILN